MLGNTDTLGDMCKELRNQAVDAAAYRKGDYLTTVSDAIISISFQLQQMTACANALENMFRMRPDFDEQAYVQEFMYCMGEAMAAETECWEWLYETEEDG